MSAPRQARLRALAKLNLDLRVLGKRPDGFHELRTIFQTISLADTIDIAYTPARSTAIELTDTLAIPDNLIERAARAVMDATGAKGRVQLRLEKCTPMGAGLGGGSSDAAAVLLALPVLAGRRLPIPALCEIGRALGSDVPFFLLGGAAAAIGRGTELFPLPETPALHALLVTPDVHVSTAAAYRLLSPGLTTEAAENKMFSFQQRVWAGEVTMRAAPPPKSTGGECPQNDFESVVFQQHPSLAALKRKLIRAGASVALMSGSGSALFGLFRTRDEVTNAVKVLGDEKTFRVSLVSRPRYRSLWWRALEQHINGKIWPPQSRYTR